MASTTTNLSLNKFDGGDYIDHDKINDNYDKLDKLGIDYVTEQGTKTNTNGAWTYRKFKSGIAECWIKADIGVVTGSMDDAGKIFVHYGVNWPFTFSEAPVANFNAGCTGTREMHALYINTTTGNADIWIQKYDQTALDVWVYIHAIGKV